MKLKYQVCTFEQAKKLTETGLKTRALHVWALLQKNGKEVYVLRRRRATREHERIMFDSTKEGPLLSYPAYSGDELAFLLPATIRIPLISEEAQGVYPLHWKAASNRFISAYKSTKTETLVGEYVNINEHEAWAKADLLLRLLRNKVINPKELTL